LVQLHLSTKAQPSQHRTIISPGSVSSHSSLTGLMPPAVRRSGQALNANWSASGPDKAQQASSSRRYQRRLQMRNTVPNL
jgi:hypothetical protein